MQTSKAPLTLVDTVCQIGSFYVTSYKQILQVIIFTAMLVSSSRVTVLRKACKMFNYFLLSSYHITRLQPSDKNISTHTRMKFQSSKFQRCLLFFSLSRCVKGNQEILKHRGRVSVYRIVQTLYIGSVVARSPRVICATST